MKPRYEKKKEGLYVVRYNGLDCGELVMGDDGFFEWWPDKKQYGCLPAWFLRDVADCLDSLNFVWDRTIQTDPNI